MFRLRDCWGGCATQPRESGVLTAVMECCTKIYIISAVNTGWSAMLRENRESEPVHPAADNLRHSEKIHSDRESAAVSRNAD